MANDRRAVGDAFFRLLPRRSIFVFLSAVFFTFAPVSFLLSSSFEQQRPVAVLLWAGLISGALAVCWAATFTLSRLFIVGIVLLTVAVIAFSGPMRHLSLGLGAGKASVEGFAIVAAIVVGYILFIVFISGQGRTTLRLQTEMALARTIHETLVPPLRIHNERIEVFGVSRASTEMGGDLIDVVPNGERTDLFVADVSGHGVRAGVVMGMVKSALRMGLLQQDELRSLATRLNVVIEQTTSAELYATMAAIRIDHARSKGEYLLAGHHHLLLYRAGSEDIERLAARSMPLGLFSTATYETRKVDLRAGDLLAIYTDGLNETTDAEDLELGHEAIERCLRGHAASPLADISQAIFSRVEAFGGQVDDRSLLLARLR